MDANVKKVRGTRVQVRGIRRRRASPTQSLGTVFNSLDDSMTAKVDDVKQGHVEDLLRAVRAQYYKATLHTKHRLKSELEKAQLEDHADLSA